MERMPPLSRNIYLEDIGLDEAVERWWRALAAIDLDQPLPGEWIAVAQARGRVTAEPVWALTSSPHYHAAAMDGYAVRAAETLGALETDPLRLAVPTQAVYVDTGCLLYTSPSPRDRTRSRMPSSA